VRPHLLPLAPARPTSSVGQPAWSAGVKHPLTPTPADIRTWHANVEQHASEGVNKILIGNKCDWTDKKVRTLLLAILKGSRGSAAVQPN